jgi:GNAT superfamily N-acetyltransferase
MVVKEVANDINDIVGSVSSGRFDNQIDRALFSNNMQALERSIKKQKYYFKSYFGNTDEEIAEFSRLFEERKKERYESYLRAIELMKAIVSGEYDDKIDLGDYSVEEGFTGLQKHMLHGAIMHRLREIGSINFKLVKENGKQGEGRYTVYNLPSNDVAGYLNFFVKDKKRFMNGYGKYVDAAAEKDAFNGLNSATEEVVYITLLYVSGIYRNNGVAKMLMNKLIEDYGQYTIVLNAHSGAVKNKELKRRDDISNFDIKNTRGLLQPRLVKFYKSFGFVGGGRNKYDSFMVRNPGK